MKCLLISFFALTMLSGCAFSLYNLSTNGKSSDVIDEQQSASPEITSEVHIPVAPL